MSNHKITTSKTTSDPLKVFYKAFTLKSVSNNKYLD